MNNVKVLALIAFIIAIVVSVLYAFHVVGAQEAIVILVAELAAYIPARDLIV